MSGYVRAQRARFSHHLFAREKFCRGYAWDWMVAQARFADGSVSIAGKTVPLKRGQFSHSIRFMAEAWNWDKAAVSRFIARLKSETMIETDTETGQVIVTICNYDEYQADAKQAETLEDPEPRQQRDSSETKNKKGKKVIRETNVSLGEFAKVWAGYPRKVGKGSAEAAWAKARKLADYETIAGPLRAHVRAMAGKDPKFIPHLSTWLNQRRWEDEAPRHEPDPEDARLANWGIADAKPFRPELTVVEGGYAEPERLRDQRSKPVGDAEDDLSGMLPWTEEEARPLPFSDVQAGRGGLELPPLRAQRRVLL